MLLKEIQSKMEFFCAYQDRCHEEVITKLHSYPLDTDEMDTIMVHLIQENFLNEERFAKSFARGKHRIKHWGKIRIVNELKFKKISPTLITTALKEISPEEYLETFTATANKQWELISEKNIVKKRKKFCDYLLRKGFEATLVYEKVKELELES